MWPKSITWNKHGWKTIMKIISDVEDYPELKVSCGRCCLRLQADTLETVDNTDLNRPT